MASQQNRRSVTDELRRGRQETQGVMQEITEIAGDFQTLLRQEVQLAKAEVQEQVQYGIRSMVWGVMASLFGFVMLIFLFTAVMLAINLAIEELWISAFITTGIAAVLALGAALLAYMRIRQIGPPQKTMESLKEDAEWAKTQVKSSSR